MRRLPRLIVLTLFALASSSLLSEVGPGSTVALGPDAAADEPTAAGTPAPVADKIAFVSTRDNWDDIFVVNADGSNLVNLTNSKAGEIKPAWSPDGGHIAYQCSHDLCVMNADGSGKRRIVQSILSGTDPYAGPPPHSWSPDGRRIALLCTFASLSREVRDICVVDSDGSNLTNLTNNPARDGIPAWSPDGEHIAFVSDLGGTPEIYVVNADGSGLARLTHTAGSGVNVGSPTWSPDGRRMAFGEWEIFVVNADGSGLTNLTKRAGRDVLPAWSPDGRRIAYVSEGRERGLCVMDADGSNDTCLHKGARPDFPPSWSPDGQHIVVASEGYRIWCVSADGSSTIQVTSGPAQCRQGSQRICWDFQPTWSPAKQGIPTPVPLPKPPIEEQLASIAGKYDFIFGWQEEHQSWAWHIPEALGSSLQELQPGKGYFIWMKEAAAMTHGGRSWALLARWNLIGFY